MEGFDYESSDGGIEILDDFTGYEHSKNAAASSSTMTSAGSLAVKNLDTEIAAIDDQIASLRQLRSVLQKERQSLLQQASSEQARQTLPLAKKKKSAEILLDYTRPSEPFEWASQLKKTMEKVWGITSFRLCQEGVCNANMDGRDILCVMPTGGGKSLCYQLPALLSPGTTIIISPLLSLIADQVLNLREAGVECVMLTGTTSKQEQNEAFARMITKPGPGGRGKEIKLCYVTPEKVAKSKRLISVMEQLATSGRLARIVIDEAHCCSALGHDFRPDYKRLSVLKSLFPKVPILAVTATLSQKVLPDLLKILKLPPLCDGRAANSRGTCAFSAPLYRKNLHYKVLPKATNAKVAIQEMADWIREHHPEESGIVYCLSKKDTEVVAQGLMESSQGSIKTGVYHADVADAAKERIHRDWKRGKLHCVCATIAFGLGIDKAETRYVVHASMSKSMDGYYQETGRAGRDGARSDCVLYYRHQDASRILSLTLGETDGQSKVHDMLRYAQDITTCRNKIFGKYFASSALLSSEKGDKGPENLDSPCGHCDNCCRSSDQKETLDMTRAVWKALKVAEAVSRAGGRVTLSGLADVVRGLAGGTFPVVQPSKAQSSETRGAVDLEALCGGKLILSKERTETLLLDLILNGYLQEDFHATAYAVNVYVQPGPKAMRYTRLASDAVDDIAASLVYDFTFLATGKSAAQSSTRATAGVKRKSTAKKGTPGDSKKRVKGRDRTSETPDSDFDFEVEQMALEEFELYG